MNAFERERYQGSFLIDKLYCVNPLMLNETLSWGDRGKTGRKSREKSKLKKKRSEPVNQAREIALGDSQADQQRVENMAVRVVRQNY